MAHYRHCVFLLLDGARPDVLGKLISQGALPHFQKLFVEKGAFTRGVTVFPSTTGAAYLPYLTGLYPGHCNVPGIRWFDRKQFSQAGPFSVKRFRSYVGIENYFFNSDLRPDIKTIFELTDTSINIFNPMSRGTGLFGDRARFKRALYTLYAHYSHNWQFMDRWAARETRRGLKKKPHFLFTAFPGVDELSHHGHPFSQYVLAAYRQFDQELGRCIRLTEKLKIKDDTLFVLASDHGLSPTHAHFDLVGFMEAQGYSVFYYPKVFRKNVNVAVMQSGNAMAHIYVKPLSGWHQRQFARDVTGLIDLLSKRPEVSWVASLTEEGEIYVRSKTSEAWISAKGDKILYRTKGGDPFGFKGVKSIMEDRESLEVTFGQTYPDACRQLIQLFSSERTGDIVVNAAPGYDLRSTHEWPEHFSSHGSLHRDHMHIPLAFSHPIDTGSAIRSVDIFPTVCELLGLGRNAQIDGHSLVI